MFRVALRRGYRGVSSAEVPSPVVRGIDAAHIHETIRFAMLLTRSGASKLICSEECKSIVRGRRTHEEREGYAPAHFSVVFVLLLVADRSATGIRVVPRDPSNVSIAFTSITRDVHSQSKKRTQPLHSFRRSCENLPRGLSVRCYSLVAALFSMSRSSFLAFTHLSHGRFLKK